MKYWYLILLIFCCVFCCKESFDLNNLSGYWEIDKVILKNGNVRDYGANTTIDYFGFGNDSTGFRKKMDPRLDGTYQTSEDYEPFKVLTEDPDVFIQYTTPYMQWKEQILTLTEDELVVKNENSIRYIYKRFTPITME